MKSRLTVVLLIATGCTATRDVCELDGEPMSLPAVLHESSGLTASRTHRGILWTHNDSGGGESLFAIDEQGQLRATITLDGVVNRDWEDIAVAECPPGGPKGDCIYLADIGDNRAVRDDIGIWVLPEPDPTDQAVQGEAFLRVRYPGGPRDAEAIAILDDHRLLIVTKGREHPIEIYRSPSVRWPGPADTGDALAMQPVQRISERAVDLPQQVTGASIDARGRRLALRSYAALQFYRFDEDGLHPLLDIPVALDPLAEPQGEGVAIGRDGVVFLSSEAGPQGIAPRLTRLRCRIP